MNLIFSIDMNTPDEEFVDKVSIVLPDGLTPLDATNPFPGGHEDAPAEALNAFDGQTVSWGDNDNSYGGCVPGVFEFYINVAINDTLIGDLEFTYEVSGDQFKGTIHEVNGTGTILQIPATAELIINTTGVLSEYYAIPFEQASFTPNGMIHNIASVLDTNTNVILSVNEGYTDTFSLVVPFQTGEAQSINFENFTAVDNGVNTFTFSTNFTEDANPEGNTYTKDIMFGTTLRRDNGDIEGNIGIGNPGGELGNLFQIFKQDTITSVSFELNSERNEGDVIYVKIRELLDGQPGAEIGSSLPFTITTDSEFDVPVFPPVILEAGTYYIGLVEGANNIQLATTTTAFTAHSAWAFFNDKWNDLGNIGFENTYKLRAHFAPVVYVDNDLVVEAITTKPTYELGDIAITGSLRNLSNTTAVTEFDLTYTIDGGDAVTEHLSDLDIAPGATYDFEHGTMYASVTGIHTLEISVAQPNGNTDENLDDNTKSTKLIVVDEVFNKVVVGEEATGTWCGWCVRGHVGLKDMEHNHDDTEWIGIAVHNGDPMADTEYDGKISAMVSGYPSGVINRDTEVDPEDFELLGFQAKSSDIPVGKVAISRAKMDEATRNITVTTTSTFALDIADADYNLSMIIVEDGVTGTTSGFDQVNYYAQLNISILDHEGIDWSTLGQPIPAADMVYNHVGREIVGGWNGVNKSVPASVTYNTPNEYVFTTTIPDTYNAENVKVVVLLLDNETGAIVNAAQEHLEIAVGTHEVGDASIITIYPNPTTGLITVDAIAGSDILVYDLLGKIVYKSTLTNDKSNINLNGLQNGTYSVEIINNNTVYSKKVVLVK